MIGAGLRGRLSDCAHSFTREFRADVLRGLHAPEKNLPCKYFYNEAGSDLFEQITELEE